MLSVRDLACMRGERCLFSDLSFDLDKGGLLHLIGIAFGLLVKWPGGRVAVRGAGGVISLAGIAFLTGLA